MLQEETKTILVWLNYQEFYQSSGDSVASDESLLGQYIEYVFSSWEGSLLTVVRVKVTVTETYWRLINVVWSFMSYFSMNNIQCT